MVILAPMFQVGCANACAFVTLFNSSVDIFLKGPPLQVRSIFSMRFPGSIHWNIAECSLSTGSKGTLFSVINRLMSSPATTKVSLFARAIIFPALMALMVGRSPANPTIDAKTISTFSSCTTWHSASAPAYTLMGKSFNASFTF